MSKPMNLYVQMDVDLGDHFKLMRATTKLNADVSMTSAVHDADCQHTLVTEESVVGYMYRVWSWALRFDPEGGSLDRLSEPEIARVAHYPGDSNTFVKTMIEEGLLTSDLGINGWDEVYGPLNDRRKKNAASQRKSRSRKRDEGVTSATREAKSNVTNTNVTDDPDV